MAVRRQSQGFSRGTSSFRGVTHHPSGRWEARIGIPGSKHIYLGLWGDEREAARAYDRALVRLRGRAAATNFALSGERGALRPLLLQPSSCPAIPPSACGSRPYWRGRLCLPCRLQAGDGRLPQDAGGEFMTGKNKYEQGHAPRGCGSARLAPLCAWPHDGEAHIAAAAAHFPLAPLPPPQKMLHSDRHFSAISDTPSLFERWIKAGCEAFPELCSPTAAGARAGKPWPGPARLPGLAGAFAGLQHVAWVEGLSPPPAGPGLCLMLTRPRPERTPAAQRTAWEVPLGPAPSRAAATAAPRPQPQARAAPARLARWTRQWPPWPASPMWRRAVPPSPTSHEARAGRRQWRVNH